MSATSIDLEWGGGTQTFHLDIPRLKELQERAGSGPAEILARLTDGRARVEDAQEPIRCGLLGGGMHPAEVARLMKLYSDGRPLIESIAVATLVLGAALLGRDPDPEADPPGKPKAATTRRSKMAGSTSPRSKPRP